MIETGIETATAIVTVIVIVIEIGSVIVVLGTKRTLEVAIAERTTGSALISIVNAVEEPSLMPLSVRHGKSAMTLETLPHVGEPLPAKKLGDATVETAMRLPMLDKVAMIMQVVSAHLPLPVAKALFLHRHLRRRVAGAGIIVTGTGTEIEIVTVIEIGIVIAIVIATVTVTVTVTGKGKGSEIILEIIGNTTVRVVLMVPMAIGNVGEVVMMAAMPKEDEEALGWEARVNGHDEELEIPMGILIDSWKQDYMS